VLKLVKQEFVDVPDCWILIYHVT